MEQQKLNWDVFKLLFCSINNPTFGSLKLLFRR